MATVSKDDVVAVLRTVFDPEIPVNVYDLGLVYDVDVDGEEVHVVMTLTSPSCPSAAEIPDMVENKVLDGLAVRKCRVHIVWQPPWSAERITPEGRRILGLDDGGNAETEPAEERSSDGSSA
jgi:metal-sulfur cluster biosynthetic enzyme